MPRFCSTAVLTNVVLALVCGPLCASALTEFNQVNVGSSTTASINITLTSAQLSANPRFALRYGVDFTAGTCTPNVSGCQLSVAFAPKYPGSRVDAVIVMDHSGNVLGKYFVHGTGMGTHFTFEPGTIMQIDTFGPIFDGPNSLAVDPQGTFYFYSVLSKNIEAIPVNSLTPTATFGTGFTFALDSAGDVFFVNANSLFETDGTTSITTTIPINASSITSLAVDPSGNLFVIDSNGLEMVNTVTGANTLIAPSGNADSGDGGPALNAVLDNPGGLAIDASGNLYTATNSGRLREINAATHVIQTIAGTGVIGYSGDGGLATLAQLGYISGLAIDTIGNIYLSDGINHVIRKIRAATQIITTIAGVLQGLVPQTGVLANQIFLSTPSGLAVDAQGDVYFSSNINTGTNLFELVASSPDLPLNWPGSFGPAPVLFESVVNDGNLPVTLNSLSAFGPFTLQTSTVSPPCAVQQSLSVGANCQVELTYNYAAGTSNGTLSITGTSVNGSSTAADAGLTLSYPSLTPSVSGMIEFPNQYLNSPPSASQTLTLSNLGISPLLIQSIVITGPNAADFSYNVGTFGAYPSCGSTIPTGTSCSITVNFNPQGLGSRIASLVINSNDPQTPFIIPVTGTVYPPSIFQISTSVVDFGSQAPGSTSFRAITFTNAGTTPISLTFYGLVLGNGFTSDGPCPISTLLPGGSCTINIQFTPPSNGVFTGQLIGGWGDPVTGQSGSTEAQTNIPISGIGGSNSGGLLYVPITPCRAVDTRNPAGAFGGPEIAAATSRSFSLPNTDCGIPADAAAYSLNVTAVPEAYLGYMTVFPSGENLPSTSTLNSDGRVKANAAIVAAGSNGAVSVYASNKSHVVLDVNGYFVPSTENGLTFYPLTPCRIADTRNSPGPLGGPGLSANISRDFPVLTSSCNIPSNAQAYSMNITAVPSGRLGFLTAWPSGAARPLASTLNAPAQTVTANAALIAAGSGGDISLYASDPTNIIIDIDGYFAPNLGAGLSYYPVTPCRALDTRTNAGPWFASPPFDGQITANLASTNCGASSAAQAFVLNATAIPDGALGYLSLWPQDTVKPGVSTLNSSGAIVSNLAIVPTTDGAINAFASDPTQLILDISGYFAP